jgi:hypothetical protein
VDRRGFLTSLGASLLVSPRASAAQPAEKVHRIGILNPSPPPGTPGNPTVPRVLPALLDGLKRLGWTEGTSLSIEHRWAEWKPELLPCTPRSW